MGVLLPNFKKAIIDDITTSITTGTSYYYAFAANPVKLTANVPVVTTDSYTTDFISDWQMMFGKKITNNDVIPIIKNIKWETNTVYDIYDNTNANLHSLNYYVITDPDEVGGSYNVYLCLNNGNGNTSSQKPTTVQATSFVKDDGYIWRYVTSISDQMYKKFSTDSYAPIYPNTQIVAGAPLYSGVDVVVVANGGTNYRTYTDGVVQSNPLPNIIQLETLTASDVTNFYSNCGMYIYTTGYNTAELKTITSYVVNSSGRWAYLDTDANTNNITPSITKYHVAPRVMFETDGDTSTYGYAVVNTASNAINHIVITDTGTNVSRANVALLPTVYGTGANLYAVAPPPGGYGADPASELNVLGMGIAFTFNSSENNTIPVDITYNKIGLLKNPYKLSEDGTKNIVQYTNTTFNQLLDATISPTVTYNIGDTVTGQTSGAVGTIAFANTTTVFITGDKTFSNLEYITSDQNVTTQITINTKGQIYAKDIEPLYVQNLADIKREDQLPESYKLIIKI